MAIPKEMISARYTIDPSAILSTLNSTSNKSIYKEKNTMSKVYTRNQIYIAINHNSIPLTVVGASEDEAKEYVHNNGYKTLSIRRIGKAVKGIPAGVIDN